MSARRFLDVVYSIAADGAESIAEVDEALSGPRPEKPEDKFAKIRALGGDIG